MRTRTVITIAVILGTFLAPALQAQDTWTQKTPVTKPFARSGHAMASLGGDQVLLFGGWDGANVNDETWVYDLSDNAWTLKNPATKPSGRAYHGMASLGGDQVLLFGSFQNQETWVYDLSENTWTLKNPATKPSARYGHAMAPVGNNKVLLFGGISGGDETWVYDLNDNTWSLKTPATKPSARMGHTMASLGGDKVLLFGWDDTTWVYDLSDNTWSLKSPVTKPLARGADAKAYLGGDQVLLFGGLVSGGGHSDETWVYDLSDNTWTLRSQATKPLGRSDYAMASLGSGQVLLFGGFKVGDIRDDETWVYTAMTAPNVIANGGFEQGTANWTMYSAAPNGMSFSTVGGPSGSYAKVLINATSNNMQVYQTYFSLTAGKRYTIGFDAYSPTSRKVFVTVHKHNAPYGSYGFGEWIQLGPNWTHYERQFTAAGFSGTTSDTRLRFYLVYACAAGDDYYFDNVSLAQVLAKAGEEQIAEQPTAFLLEQNFPNPFNPSTTVRYQIPDVSRVSLKVYDMLGREAATLVDDVRGPGVYEAVFDAKNLSSGMYFYKFESGTFVQTKKMLILR
jgi:hypothetical protein